jgi:predicted acylesterase/phospholipase RssA
LIGNWENVRFSRILIFIKKIKISKSKSSDQSSNQEMKIILLLTLCCLFFVANGFKCRALALGGGGDRGAYEGLNFFKFLNFLSAGILQAFSQFEKDENMKWDVISGISAGAINAGILSSYPKGSEKKGKLMFSLNKFQRNSRNCKL